MLFSFSVYFRHSCRIVLSLFLLLEISPGVLFAANPTITLQVSSETAPPGGYAQFKITLTEPALVATAGISMKFDPAIFGDVTSFAAFSAAGDQVGSYSTLGAGVSSPTASLGQLPGLPVFVVTVPILATAQVGASAAITVDTTSSIWTDQHGNAYTIHVNSGTFTVGGTLSIQSVTPGVGLFPPGTVITIQGTGFDATTAVKIDGVSLASTQLVSAQQIDVTLGGMTEMTGKQLHLEHASGEQLDYFISTAGLVAGQYASPLILPLLTVPPFTAVSWGVSGEDVNFNCLQNPNNFPVTAIYYFAVQNHPVTTQSVVIPPYGEYIAPIADNPFLSEFMTVSAPIRMAEIYVVLPVSGPETLTTVPVMALTGLDSVGVQPQAPSAFTWQFGMPAPQPQTKSVTSAFPFIVSVSGGAEAWLKITPTSGNGGFTTLTLTPVVPGLSVGTFTGTVTITPQLPPDLVQFGPGSTSFNVTINVTSQPLLVSSDGNTALFTVPVLGSVPPPQPFAVMSTGGPAAFTVAVVPNSGNWLSVTPASGTSPASLTLSVNTAGLTTGTYQSGFVVQGAINNLNVAVTLTVGPLLQVSPTSLSFTVPAGQVSPSQMLVISPQPSVTVSSSTQSGGSWLDAPPGQFSLLPVLQVKANAVNLVPGTYLGTVTITSSLNLVAMIPVILTVTPAPPGPPNLAVTPASLTVSAPAGSTATGNLNVSSSSGPPYFTIQTDRLNFQVTPPSSSGQFTAPATIQVSAFSFLPGTYHYSIIVNWRGGSATIPVTYYATASAATPPVMAAIVNSGSAIPGSISPGELITIFGFALGGAPTGLQIGADGKVATNLSGTQVLINGIAAPLIYSSSEQVNAIVPYGVGTSGMATVQLIEGGIQAGAWGVPLTPSAPALFTADASGVGQGAIVNPDGSVNSASNPAARGTAIQIYATGGGQTSPPSSTGTLAPAAANLNLQVKVTIGGLDAHVLYAGSAPSEVNGVVQINAIVPQTLTPDVALPVLVTISGVSSQTGVTVAIQ